MRTHLLSVINQRHRRDRRRHAKQCDASADHKLPTAPMHLDVRPGWHSTRMIGAQGAMNLTLPSAINADHGSSMPDRFKRWLQPLLPQRGKRGVCWTYVLDGTSTKG